MSAQLNIKSAEAHALAVEVAELAGESLTQAVIEALKARRKLLTFDQRMARIRKITEGGAKLWIEPWKSTQHGDLLYDDMGLPK